jgi:hypothetical protein
VNAAIVIGADEYGTDDLRLFGAVHDATAFCSWALDPNGGNVARPNLRLLLSRRSDDAASDDARLREDAAATKDNIVTAINDVVTASELPDAEPRERLYFYFSGHGITARVANRDESALVTPGFDALHPDHSLAIRSLTEFFETTRFSDQFFFLDACRNVPWKEREYEIGRWPIPRRRNPGAPPVQQFILYATSPGLTAGELGSWPGEGVGAFTEMLMAALGGDRDAKAWSWERNCYEVRWEKLATYVKNRMEAKKYPTKGGRNSPSGALPIQIPQDAGTRGVAGRERDALLVSFPRNHFRPLRLTVELKTDPKHKEAEVSVLDALGEPVASALKVTGDAHDFTLPPKTYAVRARTTDEAKPREGRVKAPVALYDDTTEVVELNPPVSLRPGQVSEEVREGEEYRTEPGTIVVSPADPLTVVELRDEAGSLPDVHGGAVRTGEATFTAPTGFYRVRLIGPEAASDEQFVVLSAGETEKIEEAKLPDAPEHVVELARAAGGTYRADDRAVVVKRGIEPLQWARPSTILAVALGDGLGRRTGGVLKRLGLEAPRDALDGGQAGVALYAAAGDGNADAVGEVTVRTWASGDTVPNERTKLVPTRAGVAAFVSPAEAPGRQWLSIERAGWATVVALPMLQGRLATVIAEVEADRLKLYELHPAVTGGPSAAPERLRRVEHLERLILGGRLDGAQALANELATDAANDPFGACLGGYALLRFGIDDEGRRNRLSTAVEAIVEVAPTLSDAYILRGQVQASAGNADDAAQAFVDAVNVGIPTFAEGLTRLIEGLRTTGFFHPRAALVRHIFQRHVRGVMWSAFTPLRPLEPGRLVISGADLGFEG